MLDIMLFRTDPERIKDNIRKKFQDEKLPLVDEVVDMDKQFRDRVRVLFGKPSHGKYLFCKFLQMQYGYLIILHIFFLLYFHRGLTPLQLGPDPFVYIWVFHKSFDSVI